MFILTCPHCEEETRCKYARSGAVAKCPACNRTFRLDDATLGVQTPENDFFRRRKPNAPAQAAQPAQPAAAPHPPAVATPQAVAPAVSSDEPSMTDDALAGLTRATQSRASMKQAARRRAKHRQRVTVMAIHIGGALTAIAVMFAVSQWLGEPTGPRPASAAPRDQAPPAPAAGDAPLDDAAADPPADARPDAPSDFFTPGPAATGQAPAGAPLPRVRFTN